MLRVIVFHFTPFIFTQGPLDSSRVRAYRTRELQSVLRTVVKRGAGSVASRGMDSRVVWHGLAENIFSHLHLQFHSLQ